MSDKFTLDSDGNPVAEYDLLRWARWMEANERSLRRTNIGQVCVSTVFLGIDHGFDGGRPVLWETMIFGGPTDAEQQWRYTSKSAAIDGHASAVKLVTGKRSE